MGLPPSDDLRKLFPGSSSFHKLNAVDSVARQKLKSNPQHELVAEDALQAAGKVRCLVRFTLLRRRLLDDDNPYLKPFLDGLKEAGVIVDDSPTWCRVEVIQKLVAKPENEGILICVTPL